jgi:hypothetical protein
MKRIKLRLSNGLEKLQIVFNKYENKLAPTNAMALARYGGNNPI